MLTQLERDVARNVIFFALSIVACRFTNGAFGWALSALGCISALAGNIKWTCACFVFTPLLIFFSPALVSGDHLGPSVRIGQICMLFCMLFSPTIRNRRDSIPVGLLFLYSVVAIFSSINGWMPVISYLKILNFVLFLIGILVIGRMIQHSDESLYQLRTLLLALGFLIVVGSVITYFIPSIGYSMEVRKAASWGNYTTGAEVAAKEGKVLFNGILNHSQTLATNVPLWFAWTLCDMFSNERKPTKIHWAIILASPFLMYMSRSRTALVVLAVSLFMIWLSILPTTKLSAKAKSRVKLSFYLLVVAIVAGLVYGQISNQTLSKWLRKSDDVSGDTRSLSEAFTSTRMGLVEYNLHDFRLNPILGKGFQVMSWHEDAYNTGHISLLSAPIEKGVLPLMVLGETGTVGGIVFIAFLSVFYGTCIKRRYINLMCLFTAYLASNMSEADFFSPGGGAAHWTATVIGGFCLDMISKRRSEFPFGWGHNA